MINLSLWPITSEECHAWFHLYGTCLRARRASKATKYDWKILPHSWTRTHFLELSSLELYRLSYTVFDERCPIKLTFMHTCTSDTSVYKKVHWYRFENDEVKRILSFTWTVLCYILECIYIGQIVRNAQVLCLLSTCTIRPNTVPD